MNVHKNICRATHKNFKGTTKWNALTNVLLKANTKNENHQITQQKSLLKRLQWQVWQMLSANIMRDQAFIGSYKHKHSVIMVIFMF